MLYDSDPVYDVSWSRVLFSAFLGTTVGIDVFRGRPYIT